MKGKKVVEVLGSAVAETLLEKTIENVPGIMDRFTEKKEEKTFFEKNKSWIFIIILSIFVIKLDYINMFNNIIFNSIINIIYGIIVLVLLCLFYYEEKHFFKINSLFMKTVIVSLITLGVINSFYHIIYAISNLFTSIL